MFKYTVVVNTYPRIGRDVDLGRCLDSIFHQTFSDYTILVVENYKDLKDISSIVGKYKSKKIKVVNSSVKRLPVLFNMGWKNTKSPYLAYLADDCVAEKTWLANMDKEFLKNANLGVVTGPVLSTCFPVSEMHRLFLLSQRNIFLKLVSFPYIYFALENKPMLPGRLFESGAYSMGAAIPDAVHFRRQEIDLATTTSMGIRRSVIEKIGGFDETFNFNHADGDLFIRIKEAGYKIIFTSKVVVHHYVRLGPSRNAYFIGKDTGIFYRKHIRPKSFNGFIGALLNIMVLNLFWIFSAIRDKNTRQLIGIKGFFEGVMGSSV